MLKKLIAEVLARKPHLALAELFELGYLRRDGALLAHIEGADMGQSRFEAIFEDGVFDKDHFEVEAIAERLLEPPHLLAVVQVLLLIVGVCAGCHDLPRDDCRAVSHPSVSPPDCRALVAQQAPSVALTG